MHFEKTETSDPTAAIVARVSALTKEKTENNARVCASLRVLADTVRHFSERYAEGGGVFRGGKDAKEAFEVFCRLLTQIEPQVGELERCTLPYTAMEDAVRALSLECMYLECDDVASATHLRLTLANLGQTVATERAALQALCREQIPRFLRESAQAADLCGDGAACAPARLTFLCGILAGSCEMLAGALG